MVVCSQPVAQPAVLQRGDEQAAAADAAAAPTEGRKEAGLPLLPTALTKGQSVAYAPVLALRPNTALGEVVESSPASPPAVAARKTAERLTAQTDAPQQVDLQPRYFPIDVPQQQQPVCVQQPMLAEPVQHQAVVSPRTVKYVAVVVPRPEGAPPCTSPRPMRNAVVFSGGAFGRPVRRVDPYQACVVAPEQCHKYAPANQYDRAAEQYQPSWVSTCARQYGCAASQ